MNHYELMKILIEYNIKTYDELHEYRSTFFKAGKLNAEQNEELIELIEAL